MNTRRLLRCGVVWVALLLALPLPAIAATSPVLESEVIDPRPFGYVIGDTLTRRIVLEADRGATIDAGHLPKPGRASSWLEVVKSELRSARAGSFDRHEITLTYQIFNSAPEVKTLVLPKLSIPFKTDNGTVLHEVPEFLFTVAPLTPPYVTARAGLDEIRADAAPVPVPSAVEKGRLVFYGLGLAGIAGYFLYAYAGLPFLSRSRGPFARALKAVRAAAHTRDEREALRAAVKAVHRAFDETAGATVFSEQLEWFFATHREYGPLRPAVEEFFAASRSVFFGDGGAGSLSVDWLIRFCRQLRDAERGVA